ncbi:hypothetical protein MSG28_012927 [Choristoneura fumiferana]|uniref:Uncharacterized protein n=1 Tax=Choristoneura fumiferana TaxID=7141 RepID=A0ACC0KRT9_CHOFU|nr:hypothetical protein MSG28_012927 [Choristoneura fumiferana]
MAQTQNSILRISDEKTLQLIDLYEKEECLWNTYSDDYKCREKRQRAAEHVARRLNLKHFEARHVVIKFKNLRNSYCQELKKIIASRAMGLRDEEMYKPKVFWFSKMDSFLRPHLQPTRCSFQALVPEVGIEERIKVEARSESSDSNIRSNEIDDMSDISEYNYPVIEHSESVNSDDCIQIPEPRTLTKRTLSCAPPISPKRLREDTNNNDQMRQMIREMSNKIDAIVDDKKEDYYDTFGKYIASLLRSMPKERAMMLQPQVISLIVSGSGFGDGSVNTIPSARDEREFVLARCWRLARRGVLCSGAFGRVRRRSGSRARSDVAGRGTCAIWLTFCRFQNNNAGCRQGHVVLPAPAQCKRIRRLFGLRATTLRPRIPREVTPAAPYGGPDDGDTTTQRHFLIPTRMGSGNDTTKHSKPDRARPKSLWQQIPQAQRKLASPRRNLTLNVTLSPYGGPDDGDTTTQRHFLIPTRTGPGNDTTKHSKPDRAGPKSLWQQIPQAQRKLASPRRNLTLNVTLSTGAVHMDTIKSDLTDQSDPPRATAAAWQQLSHCFLMRSEVTRPYGPLNEPQNV